MFRVGGESSRETGVGRRGAKKGQDPSGDVVVRREKKDGIRDVVPSVPSWVKSRLLRC